MFKQFEEFMIAYNYTLLKASKYDKIYWWWTLEKIFFIYKENFHLGFEYNKQR